MKKIFLYAYDRVNLGDDLFVHTIANRYPDVKFYLWSTKNNEETFKSIRNLKVIDKDSSFALKLQKINPSLFARYKAYLEKRCNALVYIGGSIFIEYDNWQQIATWWEYEAKIRNFFILGANFGPYKTEAYRQKFAEIFADSNDVCFRDKYSYNLFSEVSTVRYAPDILLNMQMPKGQTEEKKIFISVIDCGSRKTGLEKLSQYENDYIQFLMKAIVKFTNKNYSVVLCSFCTQEKDPDTIDKLMNTDAIRENKNMVTTLYYDGTNYETVLNEISQAALVIASRFHAMILGFAAKRKVFPIIYSDKTLNVLNDMGFNKNHLDIRKIDASKSDEIIDKLEDNYFEIPDDVLKRSEEHFVKLDELLGVNDGKR